MLRRKSWKKKFHWVLAHKYYPSHLIDTTSTTTTTLIIHNNSQENDNQSDQLAGDHHTTNTPMRSPRYFPSIRRSTSTSTSTSTSSTRVLRESPNSLATSSKHVVIVMDALKDFSHEPLQWALDHVIATGYTVTLLGVMPWLNLPLSSKTWLDVWTLDLEDLPALRQRSEWNTDVKYQKVREVVQLCDKYGVVPYMKVEMGFPLRLLVLEQTTGLHASWVVFDRHHRKNRSFYAKRIPCNVVMMNGDGEMDILKKRPMIDKGDNTSTNPGESDSPVLPPIIPRVILSEKLMGILRPIQEQTNEDQID